MKKTCVIVMTVLVMCSSVAMASPLTDYKLGNTTIDLTIYPTMDADLTNNFGYNQSPQTNSVLEAGATVGLGSGFAIQYNLLNPETKLINGYENVQLNSQEFNLLKEVVKTKATHLSVFAGYNRVNFGDKLSGISTILSQDRNFFQYGLVVSQTIAPKTNLFGKAGFGTDLFNGEIGMGYELAKNLDVNVVYRVLNVNKVMFGSNIEVNGRFKGLGIGLTVKF